MKLRIATILPMVIAALALMGVAATGYTSLQAYRERHAATAFVDLNGVSRLLLRSAAQWAMERGMTNAVLRSPEVPTADRLSEIARLRANSDQAFHDAVQHLRAMDEFKVASSRIEEAERALRTVQDLRRKVDDELGRPGAARASETIDGFAPAVTDLIGVAATRLRLTFETLTTPPSAALARLVGLRHLAAEMAEYAGRERGFLAGVIGSRSRITAEEASRLAGARGHVELAWGTIAPIAERPDVPREVAAAISRVEEDYFRGYGAIRSDVLAAGASGDYKIAGRDYLVAATTGIDAILRLADAIGTTADQAATEQAALSTSNLVIAGMILAMCLGLVLLSFWIAFSRIVKPLSALTRAMGELAAGNFAVLLPGLDRKDEVGDMAHAVERFKIVAEQKARDEAEAKAREDRIAVERRKADMHRLADQFEAAIGEIVDTVSSASTELEASARTLDATAGRAKELAVVVTAASEEASSNVQSVASATEELTSSVQEISRRVQDSARMANEAVAQAEKTNDRIGELSRAAARIGDVVALIDTIAGQTNLLALNATIEAARAGDSGRGFAVVASEVKALAEQTAKATGEIGQQIGGIQSATQESVGAIRDIGGSITQLAEIAAAIAAAVEEQGAATQEIARNVQHAARGTQQVSSNVGDVEHGATETGSASSQVLSAAQMLSKDSARLKAEVGNFLTNVRAA